MNLTPSDHRKYFETRFGKLSGTGPEIPLRCPFHDDHRASFSLNVEKGKWKCHAGCGEGNVVEFEKRASNCDVSTAYKNIEKICGIASYVKEEPEATYPYVDEDGKLLFEKVRFPGKKFVQRKPTADGFEYKLNGIRRPLYNLPNVIRASHVVVVEGEKDADNVNSLDLTLYSSETTRFAATTNCDGAGKWRAEYAPFFTGKRVFIFPDNDPIGKKHALDVANSVHPYAREVRIVDLPGLPEKGDVSDFLFSRDSERRPEELLQQIRKSSRWVPPKGKLLVDASDFLSSVSAEIDWIVRGLIQRKANGFVCASPKIGKSWLALDLALSLALALPWIDFEVHGPVRTALITREDNPALTRWRMDRLLAGKGATKAQLHDYLYVNSREQSPVFRLDDLEFLSPMIADLKAAKTEFLILDVFNILHDADENDNTEMRKVLDEVNRIHREVGCSICLVHHFNKNMEGSLTQRLRGAGAIAGWAEWLVGVEKATETIRKMQFEIKAAEPPEPVFFRIAGDNEHSKRLERAAEPAPQPTSPRDRAESVLWER